MRIWVIGRRESLARVDGGVATLRDLGCNVMSFDLWDEIEAHVDDRQPPHALLIEAMDSMEAGRAALSRCRGVKALAEVPALAAVTVPALQRLTQEDSFDDIVLVPYVPAELYVRIRRAEWRRSDFAANDLVKIGPLRIDVGAREVAVDGRIVSLTHQEYELLYFLVLHRGRVFDRDHLLKKAWGVEHYGGSRTVDIHIRRLRAKLGAFADAIETVRGAGYKVREPG